jgi:FkbM family methyltransferase
MLMHRMLQRLGLDVICWRDPFIDAARLLRGREVRQVIDGGAYHGQMTTLLMKAFPQATVHCFEPQPEPFAFLERVFADEGRVQLWNCALSERNGEATLHVNADAMTTSLLPTLQPEVMRPVSTHLTATVRLDDWARGHNVERIDFLKLDLQGNELGALRGATDLLDRGVKGILIECNFRQRYQEGCLHYEAARFLQERRFRFYRFYAVIVDPDGAWRQADALFLHDQGAQL